MSLRTLLLTADAQALTTLRNVFTQAGTALEVTGDPLQALALLTKRKFEAVVVDCSLSGGAEVLQQLRQTPSNRSAIAFAIVNGNVSATDAFRWGANFVLNKPISVDRVQRTLKTAQGLIANERRRYLRVTTEVPVSLAVNDRWMEAIANDISEGGILLRAPQALPAVSRVRVRLHLPGEERALECQSDVAWATSDGRAGLRFSSLGPPSLKMLRDWIASRSDSGPRFFIDATVDVAR